MTHPIAQLLRQLADAIDGASTTPVGTIIAAAGESPEDRRKRLARDRKRRQRDKSVTYVTPSSVTERDTSGVSVTLKQRDGVTQRDAASVTERDNVTNVTRVTKRDRKRDSVTVTVPEPLDTPAFHAAWQSWLDYRKERRLKPWVSATIRATFAEMVAWGEPLTLAAIKHSIAKGYQGIYPPTTGIGPTGRKLTPVEEARAKRAADTDWSDYRSEAAQ